MTTRTFVLRDMKVRVAAAMFVESLPVAERPWEVVCRLHRAKRSLDANAYYWVRVAEIATQLGYGSDELHEVFKQMFLPPIVVDLGTEQRTVTGSSSKLTVAEFAEYVDKVEAWAGSNGFALSTMVRA